MKRLHRTLIALAALAGSLAVTTPAPVHADGACLQNGYNGVNILSTFVTVGGAQGGAILCKTAANPWIVKTPQRFIARVATSDAWTVDSMCVTVRPIVTIKTMTGILTRTGTSGLNCTGALSVPTTKLPSGLTVPGVVYDVSMNATDVANKGVIVSAKLLMCVTGKNRVPVRATQGIPCKTLTV